MEKQQIINYLRQYFGQQPEVLRVSIVGSVARGDYRPDSDLDLVLDLSKPVGLFRLGRYVADLEEALNRHVDLTTEAGISPFALPIVNQSRQVVYNKRV
jgi:predicted nucleotidyltransferase